MITASWIIVPSICRLVVQPLAGTLADSSTSKVGRRRPVLVIGSIIACFGIVCAAWSQELASALTRASTHQPDQQSQPQQHPTPNNVTKSSSSANNQDLNKKASAVSVTVAVISFLVTDITLNILHTCSRALIIDTLPIRKQSRACGWASRMAFLGQLLGYFFSYADLVSIFYGILGTSQLKSLAVLSSVFLFFSVGITAWAVTERVQIRSIESYTKKGTSKWSIRKALSAISSSIQSTTGYTHLDTDSGNFEMNNDMHSASLEYMDETNGSTGYAPIRTVQSSSYFSFIERIFTSYKLSFYNMVDRACHAGVVLFKAAYHLPTRISTIFLIQLLSGTYWFVLQSYAGVWVGKLWIKSDEIKRLQKQKENGEPGTGFSLEDITQGNEFSLKNSKEQTEKINNIAAEFIRLLTHKKNQLTMNQETPVSHSFYKRIAQNIPSKKLIVKKATRQGMLCFVFFSLVSFLIALIIPGIIERLKTRREKLIKYREKKLLKNKRKTNKHKKYPRSLDLDTRYGHTNIDIQLETLNRSAYGEHNTNKELNSPAINMNKSQNPVGLKTSSDFRRISRRPGNNLQNTVDPRKRHSLDPRFFANFDINNPSTSSLSVNSENSESDSLLQPKISDQKRIVGESSAPINDIGIINSPVNPTFNNQINSNLLQIPRQNGSLMNISMVQNELPLKISSSSNSFYRHSLDNSLNAGNGTLSSTLQPSFHTNVAYSANKSHNFSTSTVNNVNNNNDAETASIHSFGGIASSLIPLPDSASEYVIPSTLPISKYQGIGDKIKDFFTRIAYAVFLVLGLPLKIVFVPVRMASRKIFGWLLRQVILKGIRGILRLHDAIDIWIDNKLIEGYNFLESSRTKPKHQWLEKTHEANKRTDRWVVNIWSASQCAYAFLIIFTPYITRVPSAKAMIALIGISKGIYEWVSYSILGEEILRETEGEGIIGAILEGHKINSTMITNVIAEETEGVEGELLLTRGSRAEDIEDFANKQYMSREADGIWEDLEGNQPDYSNYSHQQIFFTEFPNSEAVDDSGFAAFATDFDELVNDSTPIQITGHDITESLNNVGEERMIYVAQPAFGESSSGDTTNLFGANHKLHQYGKLGRVLNLAKKKYGRLIRGRPRRGSESSIHSTISVDTLASGTSRRNSGVVTTNNGSSTISSTFRLSRHSSSGLHSLTEDDFYSDPFSQDMVRTTGAYSGVYVGLLGASYAVGQVAALAVCYLIISLFEGFNASGSVLDYLGLGIAAISRGDPFGTGTGIVAVLTLSAASAGVAGWLIQRLHNSD